MQCCKKSEPNKENGVNEVQKHSCCGGLKKHMVMMFLCCLAPIGAILLLNLSGYEGAASYLVFLLCPLMHLFMMKGMGHKHQEPVNEINMKK